MCGKPHISSSSFYYVQRGYLSIYWTDFHDFFHQMEGICVNFLDPVQFFRFLKDRCHGNQFCSKIVAKLPTLPTLIAIAFRNGIEYRYLNVRINSVN